MGEYAAVVRKSILDVLGFTGLQSHLTHSLGNTDEALRLRRNCQQNWNVEMNLQMFHKEVFFNARSFERKLFRTLLLKECNLR